MHLFIFVAFGLKRHFLFRFPVYPGLRVPISERGDSAARAISPVDKGLWIRDCAARARCVKQAYRDTLSTKAHLFLEVYYNLIAKLRQCHDLDSENHTTRLGCDRHHGDATCYRRYELGIIFGIRCLPRSRGCFRGRSDSTAALERLAAVILETDY